MDEILIKIKDFIYTESEMMSVYKAKRWKMTFILSGILLIFSIYFFTKGEKDKGIFFIAISIIWPFYNLWNYRRIMKKYTDKSKDEDVKAEVDFYKNKIVMKSKKAKFEREYNDLYKIEKKNKTYILQIDKRNLFGFSEERFTSEEKNILDSIIKEFKSKK